MFPSEEEPRDAPRFSSPYHDDDDAGGAGKELKGLSGDPTSASKMREEDPESGSDVQQQQENEGFVWTVGAKVFLLSVGLFVLVSLVLIVVLEVYQARSAQETLVEFNVYLQVVTILSQLFLMGASVLAVRTGNLIMILSVVLFNIYLVCAGILEASQRTSSAGLLRDRIYPAPTTPTARQQRNILVILWLIPALDMCFHLGVDWSAWKLYRELGWGVYKKVSASITLRQLYQRYLILQDLQLFSVFFALIQCYVIPFTAIMFKEATRANTDLVYDVPADVLDRGPMAAVFVVGFLFYAAAMALTLFASRREHKVCMLSSIGMQLLYVGFAAYQIYLLREIFSRFTTLTSDGDGAVLLPLRTILQTSVATLLTLSTFALSIWVYLGFGEGLKEIHQRSGPAPRSQAIDLSLE